MGGSERADLRLDRRRHDLGAEHHRAEPSATTGTGDITTRFAGGGRFYARHPAAARAVCG